MSIRPACLVFVLLVCGHAAGADKPNPIFNLADDED